MNACQTSETNLGSLSNIINFSIPQSPLSRVANSAYTHCSAFHLVWPGIAVIHFVNLSITDITASKVPESGNATIISMVMVWKGIGGVRISYITPYSKCRLVCFFWHSGQNRTYCFTQYHKQLKFNPLRSSIIQLIPR
jgi:hypothetical protein